MAVSGGEMEAPATRKWLEAIMGNDRKRERERERERRYTQNEKEGAICILIFGLNIIDG